MDRDFVKKVLAMKEGQLSALTATPANAAARAELSKEITSINIYLKCGEIADIVGMNVPTIEALNYVPAAFHDHTTDSALDRSQKRRVTILKNELATLAPNLKDIFEKRVELYKLSHGNVGPTSMNDLIGIEKIPYSPYLGVDPADEARYNAVRGAILALNPNDTVVDFAAMRPLMLADAMDKLNNASTDREYQNAISQYFPVIEEFMRTDHDATVAYFKNIGNPKFAAELKQKYPNEEILLSVAGTDKILKRIKRLTPGSDNYKNELNLFKENFARLYENSANHTELNRILNSARRSSKFEFRSDLQAALADIDGLNADLGIRDSELADFAKYVSDHYDSMSPELQEKMYAMLKTKLENNLADQATVASANAALANVNNMKLDLKIQKDLERFDQAVYKHPNLLAYTKDIDAKIKKLTEQKSKLTAAPKLNMDGFVLIKQIDAAIDKLNNSLTTLDPAQVQRFNPTQANAANVGTDALSRTQAALDAVNTQLADPNISPMHKVSLTKQKDVYEKKIAKLQQSSNVRLVGSRFFLFPRKKVQELGEVLTARELRTTREDAYVQYMNELREEAQNLRLAGGFVNNIKALIVSGHANLVRKELSRAAIIRNNGGNPTLMGAQTVGLFGNMNRQPAMQPVLAP